MSYKVLVFFFLLLCSLRVSAAPTPSEGALIRDAEIEDVLKSYGAPLFEAANLSPKMLHLYVINSKEVNAFAMSGGRIAIHTALILKANSALQVIGVLAHETAHVAGNHIVRGIDAYEKALLQGLIGAVGGLAVGLAVDPEAGMGILLGSQEMVQRGLLKFSRSQESAADQGATRFLDRLGYSSKGLLEFMEILNKNNFLFNRPEDPYALTHPLEVERIDFFRAHVSKSSHTESLLPPGFEDNFQRIKVKIAAFTLSPAKTLARFGLSDQSLLARYGRAIAYMQTSQTDLSLKEIDALLQEYPQDAFFWDLKGQILFESGKIGDAAKAYEKAVQLRPDIPLLRVNWAHALVESGDQKNLEKAYSELLRAQTEEADNPFTYRLLAVYYGKKGNTGLAALSLAEMAFEVGDLKMAEEQAKRSLHLLKEDPKNTTRAKDLLREIKREKSL